MSTIMRNVLFGAMALVALCCASPANVQADQVRGGYVREVWRERGYRPYNYYAPGYRYYEPRYYYYDGPGYRYYEPGYRYYYYPRYRSYYGVPGYGYYRYPGVGGEVRAGPVRVWW